MRLLDKYEVVDITKKSAPKIKSIDEVMEITGRYRQQIERNATLSFASVFGRKVLIDNEALKAFIGKCKYNDANAGYKNKDKIKKNRNKAIPKKDNNAQLTIF